MRMLTLSEWRAGMRKMIFSLLLLSILALKGCRGDEDLVQKCKDLYKDTLDPVTLQIIRGAFIGNCEFRCEAGRILGHHKLPTGTSCGKNRKCSDGICITEDTFRREEECRAALPEEKLIVIHDGWEEYDVKQNDCTFVCQSKNGNAKKTLKEPQGLDCFDIKAMTEGKCDGLGHCILKWKVSDISESDDAV